MKDSFVFQSSVNTKGARNLVEEARRQRDAREAQRQQELDAQKSIAAARIVSRCIRSVASRKRSLRDLRKEWDSQCGLLEGNVTGVKADDLLRFAWMFLKFYQPTTDWNRLGHLVKMMLPQTAASQGRGASLPFSSCLNHPDPLRAKAAANVLKNVLWICAERIVGSLDGPKNLHDPACKTPVMAPYLTGTEIRFFMAYMDPKQHAGNGTIEDVMWNIQRWLIDRGLFALLAKGLLERTTRVMVNRAKLKQKRNPVLSIDSDESKLDRSTNLWVNAVLSSVMNTLVVEDIRSDIQTSAPERQQEDRNIECERRIVLFSLHVFATPLLLSFVDAQCISLFAQRDILRRVVRIVNEDEQSRKLLFNLQGEAMIFLVGNIVELYWRLTRTGFASEQTPTLRSDVVTTITHLLGHCQQYVREKSSNFVKYHAVFKWYSGKSVDGVPQEYYPQLVTQLSHLWSREFISSIFANIIDFEPPTPVASTLRLIASAPSTNSGLTLTTIDARDGSLLYLTLTSTLLAYRTAILNALSFTKGLVSGLWRLLNEVGPKREGTLLYLAAATGCLENEPLMPLLQLFCEMARLLFITLDNDEIYQRQYPFKSQELAAIVTFLNHFCFRIYWHHTPSTPSVTSQFPPVLEPAKRLLNLLNDRSQRQAFGAEQETAWLAKEVSRSTFVDDVIKNDPRAVMILGNIPQCVPFKSRVNIFRGLIESDKAVLGGRPIAVVVHRNAVLEDGYRQLARVPPQQLKQAIRVKFVNELGLEEAGIDQSGIFKEFLEEMCKRAFSTNLNLFHTTPDGYVTPSPTSFIHEEHLQLLEFVGKIFGKALYEGIAIDIPFANFIYAKLLGRYNYLDELPSLDPQLYKNLTFLKRYEGDSEDLGLTFTIDQDIFGNVVSKEIKPGGAAISVTNENKFEYVHLMADYRLNRECRDQFKALIRGFRSIISEKWLGFFSPTELQKLMCGENVEFDVKDLRAHVRYEGGYFDQHKTIRSLWQVVSDFGPKDKAAFLKFVTSCSKPPVGGFQYLNPPFTIRYVAESDEGGTQTENPVVAGARLIGSAFGITLGKDMNRLPTASTCFNMLKLPAYKKKSTLKEKLLYAINSGAGFELS
ncbi:uncharacterized protein SPPG_06078 [Spizellomyces punctatus DAOM BR117]|uniref:HECT-type E3 ubiquitin transferase n=1 Tax=Spizellomyces punctatus (strain DAOM BR117) TaxID=645134 RepID=A0A0L0H9Y4_SPIPD|nr:uncharacterized protein SPPG_06078 [Spizellomyces punctatus DAOM BR117]KNC98370.1 hypothetical protein SPPG_06078 [Spizellomyces punctatus DAOM BR117]|eukprot:XP_016606410.1 hypothetical protein SPPG_06078 [Spizellomyces punctatus DAOM BR117]